MKYIIAFGIGITFGVVGFILIYYFTPVIIALNIGTVGLIAMGAGAGLIVAGLCMAATWLAEKWVARNQRKAQLQKKLQKERGLSLGLERT